MNWRAVMLEGYDPALAPHLVVADPDNLLRDADVHLELTHRGYSVLPYGDPIAFRVAYEATYHQPLIVVLRERARTRRNAARRCARPLYPPLHWPGRIVPAPAHSCAGYTPIAPTRPALGALRPPARPSARRTDDRRDCVTSLLQHRAVRTPNTL